MDGLSFAGAAAACVVPSGHELPYYVLLRAQLSVQHDRDRKGGLSEEQETQSSVVQWVEAGCMPIALRVWVGWRSARARGWEMAVRLGASHGRLLWT